MLGDTDDKRLASCLSPVVVVAAEADNVDAECLREEVPTFADVNVTGSSGEDSADDARLESCEFIVVELLFVLVLSSSTSPTR